MKSRDAAFMVDHRRQLSGGLATAHAPRKDEDKGKKKRQHLAHQKSAVYQQQQKPSPSPASSSASVVSCTPLGSKPAKKQAKKKENKPSKQPIDAGDLLRQDSVKSRNHKLVLAPASSSAAFSSSYCVSNNFPSWGNKQKKEEMILTEREKDRAVTGALHEEILEYSMYTKATVEKMAVHIEEMIANVRASVLSLWPKSKVETFGSYSTGIWLPSSDVDLVILDVVEVNDSKLTAKHLRQLAKVLAKKKWVETLLVLDTAKVPVLKLVSAGTSVPIDITFESAATHSGLLARDLIKRYADSMPELYPLAIVFKQLLRERDLNDAYTGGLSSYSVVLMIIHFSQLWRNAKLKAGRISADSSLDVSLGEHTLMILEFFGIIFDYRKNGLSVRDGGYIYRLAENHRSQIGKPALVIEDPIHPDRNVSASSYAFSKVVALFEDSYYALKYFRASKFAPSALSCLLSTSGHTSHSKVQMPATVATQS
ncbi:hypothetical protein BBO99_00003327 [Phytophthora kernoviae]|uniref:Polymerase nucleotidyl transferase domain-containing protein n=2 Tax=Phytophthora kernoviae TaxID=325452 RepID=A0A3R7K0Y4_9STRA|nr:hypothetical protein G195_003642 [Phytophthora kernoviae 00238/432]KAG2528219.1 hypothetical protein JM16_002954 [Phytophthora kernoviae]KAG2529863.1 hypothetical protein JM18_002641 [Phytophthora kernoviae]RLN21477.1 hypothetical protein BBI17_003385 [Phytophthora kernoviae]RLN81858.1 hypothetical protein BBO99_00003327 [Phytophthora kernoviae]